MRGRPHREVALRTKARLCHAFGIRWHDYGELTRGEQLVLLSMLDKYDTAGTELEPAAPAAPARPARAERPGYTRVL